MNITIELYIFELVSVPNFSLNHGVINSMLKLIILIFWTKFTQKKYFWSKTEKSEHNPLIVHIQISRGTKFHLKLKSLLFWTKFTQKGYFHLKTEKWTLPFSSAYLNQSRYKIVAETDNFDILSQICPKQLFRSKTMNITIKFCICEMV